MINTRFVGEYEIFPDGRVFSYRKFKWLKPYLGKNGYFYVTMYGKKEYLHRLVATHFIPNPLNLPQVNHKNFIRTDNRIENLEWVSASGNALHAHTGTHRKEADTLKGVENPNSKLTEEQVLSIYSDTDSQVKIAAKYGINKKAVFNIKHKYTYKEVLAHV